MTTVSYSYVSHAQYFHLTASAGGQTRPASAAVMSAENLIRASVDAAASGLGQVPMRFVGTAGPVSAHFPNCKPMRLGRQGKSISNFHF